MFYSRFQTIGKVLPFLTLFTIFSLAASSQTSVNGTLHYTAPAGKDRGPTVDITISLKLVPDIHTRWFDLQYSMTQRLRSFRFNGKTFLPTEQPLSGQSAEELKCAMVIEVDVYHGNRLVRTLSAESYNSSEGDDVSMDSFINGAGNNTEIRDQVIDAYNKGAISIRNVRIKRVGDDIGEMAMVNLHKWLTRQAEQENARAKTSTDTAAGDSKNEKATAATGSTPDATKTGAPSKEPEKEPAEDPMAAQARAHEAEGDRYNKMGSMFVEHALREYQEAQRLYPTGSVQAKIDQLTAMKQSAQLVSDGLDKLSELTEKVNEKFEEFSEWDFNYQPFGFPSGSSGAFIAKREGALIYFSILLGYRSTHTFTADVYKEQDPVSASPDSYIPNVRLTNYFFESGPGLNIPVAKGAHLRLEGAAFVGLATFKGFEKYDIKKKNNVAWGFTYGGQFTYRIPKTRIAFGLAYWNQGIGLMKGDNGIKREITFYETQTTNYRGDKIRTTHRVHYSGKEPHRLSSLGISVIIRK